MTAATSPSSRREAWHRLAMSRASALRQATGDYRRQGLSPGAATKAAEEDAALILANATEFADAVDRDGKLDYEDAVLVEGGAGPVVTSEPAYRDNPAWFQTLAAGGTGRVDRIEWGSRLAHYLRTGELHPDD